MTLVVSGSATLHYWWAAGPSSDSWGGFLALARSGVEQLEWAATAHHPLLELGVGPDESDQVQSAPRGSTSRDDGTLEELLAAAARGIYITLILDTPVTDAKGLAGDAAAVFAALKGKAAFYTWPTANRPAVQYSAMHAKTAIADSRAALISSANLSAAAMDRTWSLAY